MDISFNELHLHVFKHFAHDSYLWFQVLNGKRGKRYGEHPAPETEHFPARIKHDTGKFMTGKIFRKPFEVLEVLYPH